MRKHGLQVLLQRRAVACEVAGAHHGDNRTLLPFSRGGGVTDVIASLKTICEDGGFEIKNLMRGNDSLPTPKLRAVVDRDLFHRTPGRVDAGDVIEIN